MEFSIRTYSHTVTNTSFPASRIISNYPTTNIIEPLHRACFIPNTPSSSGRNLNQHVLTKPKYVLVRCIDTCCEIYVNYHCALSFVYRWGRAVKKEAHVWMNCRSFPYRMENKQTIDRQIGTYLHRNTQKFRTEQAVKNLLTMRFCVI